MAPLVDALKGKRIIVDFPTRGVDEWAAACEVMVQERLASWTFEPSRLDLAEEALRLYGRRARIGVRGVRTPEQASEAAALGVHFMVSPIAAPGLLEAAGDVPLALGALTPNEVHYALGLGADSVALVPADLIGGGFVVRYLDMFDHAELIPFGRCGRIEAQQLFLAGCPAIGLSAASVFSDTGDISPDLVALRRRCQQFTDLV